MLQAASAASSIPCRTREHLENTQNRRQDRLLGLGQQTQASYGVYPVRSGPSARVTPAAAAATAATTNAASNTYPPRRWCPSFGLPALRNRPFVAFSRGGGDSGGGAGVDACGPLGPLKEREEGGQLALRKAHVLPCDVRGKLATS